MATGRSHAFEDLLAHVRWVETLAHQLVRDPAVADDLAQSTLLIALRGSAQPVKQPRAWLARVLRNLLRETRRRESQRASVESREARTESLPAPDELIARAEAERKLVAAVLALEPEHAEILLLHYFESVPLAEIARVEGVAASTVSERLARAHARLRRELAGERGERGDTWLAALAPILSRSAHVTTTGAGAATTSKVLLMSTTAKLGVAALVAAVMIAFLFSSRDPAVDAEASAQVDVRETPKSVPTEVALAPAAGEARALADAPRVTEVARAAATTGASTEAPAAPARFGRIHGRVFGVDGEPVAGRAVRLLRMPRFGAQNVKTGADGRYDDSELVPGRYHVSTAPDDAELAAHGLKSDAGAVEWLAQTSVEIEAGAIVEVDLGAPPANPIRVRGKITARDAGVTATLQWVPEGAYGYNRAKYATTPAPGEYEIVLGDPGRYRVSCILEGERPRHDEIVDVPAASAWEHDIRVPAGRFALRTVLADGTPARRTQVDVTPRAGVPPFPYMSLTTFRRATDDAGKLVVDGLRPGTYALAIRDDRYAKKPHLGAVVRTIEVAESSAAPEEVVVVLAPGRSVKGRVVARDGGELRNTDVFVFDETGEPLNALVGAMSDKAGSFKLPPLVPGRYALVGANGDRWTQPVALVVDAEGELPEPELVLDRGAALVVEFRGIESAWIDVRDTQGNCLAALLDSNLYTGAFDRTGRTTSANYYLPPGNYDVLARGATGVLARKRVALGAGENAAIELRR